MEQLYKFIKNWRDQEVGVVSEVGRATATPTEKLTSPVAMA